MSRIGRKYYNKDLIFIALVKELHINITSIPIKNKHIIIPALTGFLFSIVVKNSC